MRRILDRIGLWIGLGIFTGAVLFMFCGCQPGVTGAETRLTNDQTQTYYQGGEHFHMTVTLPEDEQ